MLATQILTHANIPNMVESWSKCSWIVRGSKQCKNVREGCLPRIDSLISTVLEQASDTYIEPRRNVWSRLAGFHKTFLKNLAHRRRSFEQTAMTVSCQYGIRVGLGPIQRSFSYHPGLPPGDKRSAITRSWCQGGVRPTAGHYRSAPKVFQKQLKIWMGMWFSRNQGVYKRILSEENSPNEVQAVGEVGMGIQEKSRGRRRTGGGRGKGGRWDKGGEQDK